MSGKDDNTPPLPPQSDRPTARDGTDCPSSDDLGEHAKIVLLRMTEGEDKPLKYPGIFHRCALMLLTKTDLLPHVEFGPELALENARKIHPEID
jgi:hydrogenase nickel incorporation protein HypB